MLIIFFIIGTIFGSFLGLVSDRWGTGASIIYGRSQCSSCQTVLRWWQLLPLISQFIFKSRCAFCGEKFSYHYFILEFLSGILFGALWFDLDLLHFLILLMSLLLSKFDIDTHSYPLNIGLGFTACFFIFFPTGPISYFWLALAYFSFFINIGIGAGDFLWLFFASFSLSLVEMLLLIQLACVFGLCFLLIKKRKKLPFIPFLSLAYLIVILLPQIL
ncbi:prepilin peptidase [Lactococcus garvieae]|uniref:Prepilin peptidase n=1 Tax=Lactococcus garvieae TaxID=1363 RepID=A0AA46TXE1_9LACT|nr:A24 family peptidase [Lactococcus garvieae]UYT10835.1 prepilin peptidase [Lactococcus garvieae]UYT12099.1 prepilin peptidase [Lactococcus garvieae]